jgi:hypothetical protein
MDWRCGSSSRAPILQAQSPEFKPSPIKKTKQKQKKSYYQLYNTQLCKTTIE